MKINRKTLSKFTGSVLLAMCMCALSNSHAGELLRSIKNAQSKSSVVTQHQVMHNVFKNYDNFNIEVKDTLDILWHNDAGNLLLRRLHENIKDDAQRITILWDTCDKEGKTNNFDPNNLFIYLNVNKFCQYVGYCGNKLVEFPETLDAVLFHELCHSLHKLDGTYRTKQTDGVMQMYNIHAMDCIDRDILEAWTDDEELYTITGWYLSDEKKVMFDCLNTNSYMILRALSNGILPNNVVQRVYHCDYASLEVYKYASDMGFRRTLIRTKKYIDGQAKI